MATNDSENLPRFDIYSTDSLKAHEVEPYYKNYAFTISAKFESYGSFTIDSESHDAVFTYPYNDVAIDVVDSWPKNLQFRVLENCYGATFRTDFLGTWNS